LSVAAKELPLLEDTEKLVRIDPASPDPDVIARAAQVIRTGGLVAFPTETVYGLGANALDAAAVRHVFEAKGRPAANPIIVHVADEETARRLSRSWPADAAKLARAFWPGPLTLVVEKKAIVPDAVTAGGPTVALRVPGHPVAQALLRAARVPIAAPSANRSTEISPTRAEHVIKSLGDRVNLVLDAGPASGGLESTVVDVTSRPARILRLGLISPEEIRAVVGSVAALDSPSQGAVESGAGRIPAADAPRRSPGQLSRHYAPRARLECLNNSAARVSELLASGRRVGWLTLGPSDSASTVALQVSEMPVESDAYAAALYAALHELDAAGVEYIIVEAPPAGEAWLAIHDRLRRAAAR
jgi:L-threonylcarbamoyladenylate synthase